MPVVFQPPTLSSSNHMHTHKHNCCAGAVDCIVKAFWHFEMQHGALPCSGHRSSVSPPPQPESASAIWRGRRQVMNPPPHWPLSGQLLLHLFFFFYIVLFVFCLSADLRLKQIKATADISVAAGRCTQLIFIILHGINLNNFHGSRNSRYFAMRQNYMILKCFKPTIIIAMIIISHN